MGANGQRSRCVTVERKKKKSCQDQCCQLFSERCVVEKLSSGYKVSSARVDCIGLEYKQHHHLYRLRISCMVLKQFVVV